MESSPASSSRASFSALLAKVQAGRELTGTEAEQAIGQIVSGGVPADEIKEFLLALRQKGEALPEIVGAARAMRANALRIRTPGEVVVDTCGTGGDKLSTFNVSTLAGLVVAAAGIPVAKHGNRAVTSACGSADLLEALGVRVDVEPAVSERCLLETGFGFLFAPRFHPAMKAVAPIRKELGVPTIFNLLGPLTNPAGVRHQVVGVADAQRLDTYAEALRALGAVRALVVRGADGQDELSTTGPTEVIEFNAKADARRMARYTLQPESLGIRRARVEEIRGGSASENAQAARRVLEGEAGPLRNAVLLNAAAGLYVAGAGGDLDGAMALARQALDQGKGAALLERVRRIANG